MKNFRLTTSICYIVLQAICGNGWSKDAAGIQDKTIIEQIGEQGEAVRAIDIEQEELLQIWREKTPAIFSETESYYEWRMRFEDSFDRTLDAAERMLEGVKRKQRIIEGKIANVIISVAETRVDEYLEGELAIIEKQLYLFEQRKKALELAASGRINEARSLIESEFLDSLIENLALEGEDKQIMENAKEILAGYDIASESYVTGIEIDKSNLKGVKRSISRGMSELLMRLPEVTETMSIEVGYWRRAVSTMRRYREFVDSSYFVPPAPRIRYEWMNYLEMLDANLLESLLVDSKLESKDTGMELIRLGEDWKIREIIVFTDFNMNNYVTRRDVTVKAITPIAKKIQLACLDLECYVLNGDSLLGFTEAGGEFDVKQVIVSRADNRKRPLGGVTIEEAFDLCRTTMKESHGVLAGFMRYQEVGNWTEEHKRYVKKHRIRTYGDNPWAILGRAGIEGSASKYAAPDSGAFDTIGNLYEWCINTNEFVREARQIRIEQDLGVIGGSYFSTIKGIDYERWLPKENEKVGFRLALVVFGQPRRLNFFEVKSLSGFHIEQFIFEVESRMASAEQKMHVVEIFRRSCPERLRDSFENGIAKYRRELQLRKELDLIVGKRLYDEGFYGKWRISRLSLDMNQELPKNGSLIAMAERGGEVLRVNINVVYEIGKGFFVNRVHW